MGSTGRRQSGSAQHADDPQERAIENNGSAETKPGYDGHGSLLAVELMHPDGSAPRRAVLGRSPLARALPNSAANRPLDLVVVEPGYAASHASAWRDRLQTAARSLAPDGVVYAAVPAAPRRRVRRVLAAEGLVAGPLYAEIPRRRTRRHLVPLEPATIRYAAETLSYARPGKRRMAQLVASFVPATLIARAGDAVVFTAQRSGARPLFDWLDRLLDGRRSRVVVSRRRHGGVVLVRFAAGSSEPTEVAKVVAAGDDDPRREATVLDRLGAGAEQAGARVPTALASQEVGGRPVLVQAALAGRRADTLIMEQPSEAERLVGRLTAWLEHWHRLTATEGVDAAETLSAAVLGPAAELAPLLDGGDRYVQLLRARCAEFHGTTLPLVAAHNDLTMANVLVDDTPRLGIVDWAHAAGDGLPLTDFFYAVVDACAAAERYGDRVAALRSCFARGGERGPGIGTLDDRLAAAVGLRPALRDLCFDACWLHHAANEHRRAAAGEERPFLAMVQALVHDRSSFEASARS